MIGSTSKAVKYSRLLLNSSYVMTNTRGLEVTDKGQSAFQRSERKGEDGGNITEMLSSKFFTIRNSN
jgi:hypothetical protein